MNALKSDKYNAINNKKMFYPTNNFLNIHLMDKFKVEQSNSR